MNKNTYYTSCCPECKSPNFTKIMINTGSIFSHTVFSHYICQSCNSTFDSKGTIFFLVDSSSVREIVQKGLDRVLSKKEMIKEFKKLHIYLRG